MSLNKKEFKLILVFLKLIIVLWLFLKKINADMALFKCQMNFFCRRGYDIVCDQLFIF